MSKNNWDNVGSVRRAGVLVPLFSVYSKNSLGIGDFNDLKYLIDWCAKTGLSILQLLPMNEVGSTFCPYDAISSFALEPMYISLDLKKGAPPKLGRVDYSIKNEKNKRLLAVYSKEKRRASSELDKFTNDNRYWLNDFALFKALKGYHGGKPWYEWEDCYKNRYPDQLKAFADKHTEEISFYKWLQWNAFNQFKAAKKYAASEGVKICGDLPILISRDSSDVWANPGYFKLDFAAGAPPDMYCAKGQRWGVPTYNWDRIAQDGYVYIKEKLKFAENFYDILRVDHVVGLFRIWSIPYNDPAINEGLNGLFDPPYENVWKEHGSKILSEMIDASRMLLVAEDLGMIPKSCPETMEELTVPGNNVQRWTKDWNVKHDFLKPKEYRKLAVAMLSTHDTTNWAAWWENEAGTIDEPLFARKCKERGIDFTKIKGILFDMARSRHGRLRWLDSVDSSDRLARILGKPKEELLDFIDMYENTYQEKEKLWKQFGLPGPMREKSDVVLVKKAVSVTMDSSSVFCIELLTDYLYMADIFKGDPYNYRINRPGTVSKDNWSMVMPISLEDLLKHKKVCQEIKSVIISSKRNV